MTRIAAEAFASDQRSLSRVGVALDKILDLDLAIILETYAEAQVQRVQELEQRRFAAMRTLTAGRAHEIRNPLNAAHLQPVVARKRLADPAPEPSVAEEAVAVAERELARLAALVDEFLDFAAPQALETAPRSARDREKCPGLPGAPG